MDKAAREIVVMIAICRVSLNHDSSSSRQKRKNNVVGRTLLLTVVTVCHTATATEYCVFVCIYAPIGCCSMYFVTQLVHCILKSPEDNCLQVFSTKIHPNFLMTNPY